MIKKKKLKFSSELRMDLVSNDWVLIAEKRNLRPTSFSKLKRQKEAKTPLNDTNESPWNKKFLTGELNRIF